MQSEIKLMYAYLNGKRIGYSTQTEFVVQVGKGKGAYRTRCTFTGQLARAFMLYEGINIGNGFKKRLLMPSDSRHPMLARAFS
jgi:hypothetical protein